MALWRMGTIADSMTCTLGTKNALDLAEDLGNGCVVVHASTSEVYGDPEFSPQSEYYRGNVNSYGPRSCYDEGKRAAEALCYDYKHKYGVDVRVIRIFNTYGPNMDMGDGRVVSNFICQALRGEDITIYGDGQQTRSFCYVDDLVDGISAVGALAKGRLVGPVNLGNPGEFTVEQLAKLVLEKLPGTGSRLINKPLPVDDPTQRKPNIFKAQELFGFEPKVSLSDGLDRTIAYFRSQLS
jgi:UDP-glucuronate decarboxylase